MDQPQTRRRSLFAPWKWKTRILWTMGIVTVLSPMAYFLSAPILLYGAIRTHSFAPDDSGISQEIVKAMIFPASWCVNRSTILRAIWDWEWKLLSDLFGPAW